MAKGNPLTLRGLSGRTDQKINRFYVRHPRLHGYVLWACVPVTIVVFVAASFVGIR